MKYKQLGNTGLYVSELTLGTMTFDQENGMFAAMLGATGQELATKMVNLSLDAGINIFDTANVYSAGQSEIMLGKALGNKRKDVLIATKVYSTLETSANALGTSRIAIMREVEASLQRLGTDYIDLYQVHNYDVTTPLEETMRALDDLVTQGKVRYIGLSNFAAWQIAKADGIARRFNTERFCSVQAYYSLVGRELERGIIPASMDLGLGTLIWSPLAGGFLTGKFTREGEASGRRKKLRFPSRCQGARIRYCGQAKRNRYCQGRINSPNRPCVAAAQRGSHQCNHRSPQRRAVDRQPEIRSGSSHRSRAAGTGRG